MNAHQLAAFGEADVTEDELRTWLTSPSVEAERDIRVLEHEGRLVGYIDVDPSKSDPPTWWCDLKLAPDADADAITAELVGWLEERADAGTLRVWTSATDARVVSAVERLGFAPVRHSYRMEIDLADGTPEPVWPAGISVRTLAGGEERRIYDAFMEVWQDTSDPPDESFEEWAHWLTREETFEPSMWFLGVERRRARRVRGLPAGRQRSSCGTRLAARRQATVAQAGARPRAAAALVSGVPAARVDTRHARSRRLEPDRARRGCTSGPGCASTGTRSFSSGPCTDRVRACRASAPAAPTAGR